MVFFFELRNIRSFLNLGLEIFISRNIRKNFLRKYKKVFNHRARNFNFTKYKIFFSILGLKVAQVAPKSTETLPVKVINVNILNEYLVYELFLEAIVSVKSLTTSNN